MIICNEFVEEEQQFDFEDFDLFDRVNLEEEGVVENSEYTNDAIERQLHTLNERFG